MVARSQGNATFEFCQHSYVFVAIVIVSGYISGCATYVPVPVANSVSPKIASFDPESIPIASSDMRESHVKQKKIVRMLLIAPEYTTEEFSTSANRLSDSLSTRLARNPWCVQVEKDVLLNGGSTLNSLLLDVPKLVTVASESLVDALVLIEIKTVRIGSRESTIDTSQSSTSKSSYSRDTFIIFRVKAFDTFNKVTVFDQEYIGRGKEAGGNLDSTLNAIMFAIDSGSEQIYSAIVNAFQPRPTVLEVRGDGRYVKVSLGARQGLRNDKMLQIVRISAVKSSTGEIISKETRPITSIPVILVAEDYSWCDASLAAGTVMIGDVAIWP